MGGVLPPLKRRPDIAKPAEAGSGVVGCEGEGVGEEIGRAASRRWESFVGAHPGVPLWRLPPAVDLHGFAVAGRGQRIRPEI